VPSWLDDLAVALNSEPGGGDVEGEARAVERMGVLPSVDVLVA